jgi:hypothetical protein
MTADNVYRILRARIVGVIIINGFLRIPFVFVVGLNQIVVGIIRMELVSYRT